MRRNLGIVKEKPAWKVASSSMHLPSKILPGAFSRKSTESLLYFHDIDAKNGGEYLKKLNYKSFMKSFIKAFLKLYKSYIKVHKSIMKSL